MLVPIEQKFGIIPRVVGDGPKKKEVARDAWGRVRRLELRGRGAMGFFLPGSQRVFVILLTYTISDYRDVF